MSGFLVPRAGGIATHCFRKRTRSYATEAALLKPSAYGQTLFQSHPHLVQRQELTPGIPAEDYERRRKDLMDSLPENSVVISAAAPTKYMSANIFYKFRQASDFWYLTGFEETDAAVILEKTSNSRGYRMTLFCHGSDPAQEQWSGAKTSHVAAKTIFAADEAHSTSHFLTHLRGCASIHSHVYIDLPSSADKKRKPTARSLLKQLTTPLLNSRAEVSTETDLHGLLEVKKLKPLAPEISRLRAIKSSAEQKVMRQAADLSGRAHAKTMRFARPGLSEAALAAHFEYICALGGSQRPAYVPVVASGPNALIIHYTSNNQVLEPNELVLMDAGCEYNGYASDITRTFPVNGIFTPPQRDLYAAILSAQKSLVALCTEQAGHSLHDLHRISCSLLRSELNQIGFGLQPGSTDLERLLYPHYLSHPIGIDLHESFTTDRAAGLRAGMVITIEPGIYVPPHVNFPKHFHQIGIRIEDEVLVSKEHPIVLSVAAPKEIADVEGACQGALGFEAY